MVRKRRAVLVMLGLLVVGCGISGPEPSTLDARRSATSPRLEPFAPARPRVAPGERMQYRLRLRGIDVATFTLAIGDVIELDGRPVVVIQSGVRSSPLLSLVREVSDQFTSWIDAETSRPILFRSTERASIEDDTIQGTDAEAGKLAHGSFPVRIREPNRDDRIEAQHVGSAPLFDANGFLMVLRGWEAEVGAEATADVIRSRYLWRAELRSGGFDSLRTELGELPALRIDGTARRLGRDGEVEPGGDTRQYSIWISDDADRVPLRMVARAYYGDVEIDLIAYQPGVGPVW